MASGDTLVIFTPGCAEFPDTDYPVAALRNNRPCLKFDDATDESCYFSAIMPMRYADSGIDINFWWGSADDEITGTVDWEFSFERGISGTTDLDANDFGTINSNVATVAGTASLIIMDTEQAADGATTDNIAGGDYFRLKVTRDISGGNMTGDAELYAIELQET